MICLEALQTWYQSVYLGSAYFYMKTESFVYLSLVYIQFSLFFLTSILIVIYFISYNGVQRLNVITITTNFIKMVVDVSCFGTIYFVGSSKILPIVDLAYFNCVIQPCRFLIFIVYCHHGARCDAYHRFLVEYEEFELEK
ncbi:Serpentine Receptor, class Z [Caenorhabditis elegans]|nr:Serpentine Receptor, class Z [Caenorhabditis elegans]CCD63596.1 Serpentine Receptor, class Z [Caenorhabditis elegans]|eukprot:NP_498647.1 Uncharacterized protein CELE_C07H6.9 [Caenorhabditis elegans]